MTSSANAIAPIAKTIPQAAVLRVKSNRQLFGARPLSREIGHTDQRPACNVPDDGCSTELFQQLIKLEQDQASGEE